MLFYNKVTLALALALATLPFAQFSHAISFVKTEEGGLQVPDGLPLGGAGDPVASDLVIDSDFEMCDVNLRVNISTQLTKDLRVTLALITSEGNIFSTWIANGNCGQTSNLIETFDDQADVILSNNATACIDGGPPVRPISPLAVFNGQNVRGTWELGVQDMIHGARAVLNQWELIVAPCIDCGGYTATSCGGCPQGYGASLCNGECVWQDGSCVAPANKGESVDCGDHRANNCGECPSGNGFADWCDGECVWQFGTCVPGVSCGGHSAPSCGDCVDGSDGAAAGCNGNCIWRNNQCIPYSGTRVDCGDHSAATCDECPSDISDLDGALSCTGECEWVIDACIPTPCAGAECLPPSMSTVDPGYNDAYRGWYDVQQCGKANDYCRWVGSNGSGGDPALRTIYGSSFWSCRLAGSNQPYNPNTPSFFPYKKADFQKECLRSF